MGWLYRMVSDRGALGFSVGIGMWRSPAGRESHRESNGLRRDIVCYILRFVRIGRYVLVLFFFSFLPALRMLREPGSSRKRETQSYTCQSAGLNRVETKYIERGRKKD